MRMLALAALTALVSGCWSGVDVVDRGGLTQHIVVGGSDMACVSCEYEITPSNAVIHVVFKKDSANE